MNDLQVALPLLGIMSTGEVAINYLNSTNYMFLGGEPFKGRVPPIAVVFIWLHPTPIWSACIGRLHTEKKGTETG
jgi:hypothetical protein